MVEQNKGRPQRLIITPTPSGDAFKSTTTKVTSRILAGNKQHEEYARGISQVAIDEIVEKAKLSYLERTWVDSLSRHLAGESHNEIFMRQPLVEDHSKLREWLTGSPGMTYKPEDFFTTTASPKYDRITNTKPEPEPKQLTAKPTTLAPSHQDWS